MAKQPPRTPADTSADRNPPAAKDGTPARKVVRLGRLDEFAEIPKGKILSVKLTNRRPGGRDGRR